MLTIDLLAASASTGLAYLLSYGGFRGPVDWLSHTTTHHGRRDQPRIALTFDDGPDPAHTPALLDALAELGVKATFFVVGEEVDANPELVRRMVAEGHELGNHTYSHRYLPLATTRRVARELAATDAAIVRATGITPTLMRPPYGGRTPFTLRACNQMGKSAVLWDVNSFDWRGGSAEEVTTRVLERTRRGSIILMHEARQGGDITIAAVRMLVPALRDRGYVLDTVSGSAAR